MYILSFLSNRSIFALHDFLCIKSTFFFFLIDNEQGYKGVLSTLNPNVKPIKNAFKHKVRSGISN
jgi:hypothetical protein